MFVDLLIMAILTDTSNRYVIVVLRMGKTGTLFKKIRDTTGTFPAKMGTIKESNGMTLIEAEGIKKRWQEYTEELYRT